MGAWATWRDGDHESASFEQKGFRRAERVRIVARDIRHCVAHQTQASLHGGVLDGRQRGSRRREGFYRAGWVLGARVVRKGY